MAATAAETTATATAGVCPLMTQSGDMPAQLAPVLTVLRFFEPPLRLTYRTASAWRRRRWRPSNAPAHRSTPEFGRVSSIVEAASLSKNTRACTHKPTAKLLIRMHRPTSAIGGKADMARNLSVCPLMTHADVHLRASNENVRYWHKADIAQCACC
jgi:hypothetical protein